MQLKGYFSMMSSVWQGVRFAFENLKSHSIFCNDHSIAGAAEGLFTVMSSVWDDALKTPTYT